MRKTILVLGAVMAVLMFSMVGAGVALADTVFSTSSPTTAEDCKNGGYAKYGFKNQGQCIKAVNHATPADTTPPEITVTGPEGQWSEFYPVYTLATNEPVSWQCTFTFTPFGGTTPTQTGSDPCSTGTKLWGANQDGIWVFTFKATDAAGNASTVTKTLLLDTTPPEIHITQGPAEGSVSSEGSFVISSNEPVQFYYDLREATYTGQPTYMTLNIPNSTQADLNINTSNADGKEMVLYLRAVDAAGNTTEIQRRWTVDITP
jgi:hypothetical protein